MARKAKQCLRAILANTNSGAGRIALVLKAPGEADVGLAVLFSIFEKKARRLIMCLRITAQSNTTNLATTRTNKCLLVG